MYSVELYGRVRRAVFVEGKSQRAVAREFGVARETVRKMLRYSPVLGPEFKPSGQYFLTVRGDTRIPSLSKSSSATRSCPQVGLLVAISAIIC
jgi:transposase-like protein